LCEWRAAGEGESVAIGNESRNEGWRPLLLSPLAPRPHADVQKITDSGSLSGLGDSRCNGKRVGDVLGTPATWPRTGAGKTKEIDAAEIYACGASFELLSACRRVEGVRHPGTTRFSQSSTRSRAARSRETTKVPRDLETVCLKVYKKNRKKRYGKAWRGGGRGGGGGGVGGGGGGGVAEDLRH